MKSKEIIKKYEEIKNIDNGRNIMGCNENWYNPIYSIGETFTKEELLQMTDKEIDNLIRLAQMIAEGLY